jgi:PAS domain S-box-containing protein
MTDSNKGLRILIVEDNPGNQYLITELLSASVIKIQLLITAETLAKAVGILQNEIFDIILLDLSLPDSTGIGTFKTVKKNTGKSPVIILSGPGEMNVAVEAIPLGPQDYHIKGDLDEKVLTRTILYCIERKLENLQESNEHEITMGKAELNVMQNGAVTRQVMNAALDAIICTDTYGKIILWNPQAEKIFGWKQQEILGKSISETIIPVEYREKHEKGIQHYLATGESVTLNKQIEVTAVNRENHRFPAELTTIPLTENGNQFFCAFIRDITDSKAAKEKESKSNEQQKILAELNKAVSRAQKPEEIYELTLDALQETIGVDKASVLLFDDNNIMQFVASRNLSDRYKKAASGHSPWGADEKDAEPILVSDASAEPSLQSLLPVIKQEGICALGFIPLIHQRQLLGKFMVYFSSVHHFTEEEIQLIQSIANNAAFAIWENRSTVALKESEAKHRLMIERNLAGVYQTTLDGHILTYNDAFANMLGYSLPAELLHKKASELYFSNEDRDDFITRLLENGELINKDAKLKHKNGTPVHVIESCSLIKNPVTGQQIIEGVILDITERVKAEEALSKSEIYLKGTLDSTNDGILAIDNNGKIITANNRFAELWQIPQGLIEQKDDQALLTYVLGQLINPKEFLLKVQELYKTDKTDFDIIKFRDNRVFERHSTPLILNKDIVGRVWSFADITERKKAEDALLESEEKYRTLVEHASDGIVIVGTDGICIDANGTICNMLGYSKEELRKRNLFELLIINKGDVPFRIGEVLAGKSVLQERNVIKKNGNTLAVELNSKLLPDNRILVIIRDITERRQIEDALRQSNERNDIVAKATNDVIWDWDLVTGKVFRSKEGLKKVYGYDDNKPIEMETDWSREVHPDDREMMKKLIEKIHQSPDQNTFSAEYRFLRQDGTYANIFDRGYIIRDEQGKPVRMIGAAQDITERKNAEEKIFRSEEQYRDLVDNISDIICTHDLSGRILSANSAAEKLLEYKFNPDGNLNIKDILTADTKDNFNHYIASIKKNGHAQGLMKIQTSSGKTRIWEYNNSLKTADGETPVIRGYARDITERKKTEYLIKKQKEQYEELVKNIPVGIYKFRMKPDGKMSLDYVSPRLCEMIGIKAKDAYRDVMGAFKVIHPDDFGGFMKLIEESFFTKQKFLWEGRGIINNQLKWMKIESSPKILEDGDILWDGVIAETTQYKKAEYALRESEETFRRLFNESADPILLLDDTGFTDCNQSAVAVFGYSSKQEILNKKPWEVSPERQPDGSLSAEKAEAMIAKALQQGYNGFEWVHIKSDGTEFPVEVMLTSIIIKGKQSFYALLRDITDRKKSEQAIKESEVKYRTLVEQAVDAIAVFDVAGKVLDVNTGSANLLGYTKEELVGMSLKDILTLDEIEISPIRYDILQQGVSTMKYRKMKKKDGTVVETEVRSQQLPDGRFLSVIRDLTERLKAQEQIEREKELSDSIINSLPGIFYLYDESGKFLRWNKNFETVSGYNSEEIEKMHPLDFYDTDQKERITERIKNVFAGKMPGVEVALFSKVKNKIPLFITSVSILYEGRNCIMGIGIDISDRKKAEQDLAESYEAIRKLTGHIQDIREDERTYIAREIHDELGQKLTVLKMDVSWLKKRINGSDEVVARRLKDLIELLDETVNSVRRISSELRPSLLDDLGLEAALEWQLMEFEKRSGIITSFVHPGGALQLPDTIKTTLFRIVQESLTNVARHSRAKKVIVTMTVKGNILVLSITDNGKGFDKQKTADKKTLGILGMQERVAMIGGVYEIHGKTGKGTEVIVQIPLNKN